MKAHRFFVLLLCAFAIFAAVSCNESTPTPDDTWGGGSSADGLFSPRTLSGFRAEIVDATALGIQNSPVGSSKRLATARNAESMNYLVKTTTEYSPSEPGYDESGLTSVTFTQITTENVTTELTGTKRLVATGSKDHPHDGTIAFMATDGFTYNVYDDSGSLKYENIIDNDSNDLDKQTGVIRVGNLTKGSKYIVEYKGTGEEITITQDDIDGEIDKLYVLNNYTFISFVPRGTSSRPSEEGLQYDSDGIAFYDKTDYYTASDRISFIIDNGTGYIYIIEDFHIKEIQGGCLLSSENNYIYDFRINENNDLEIYSLFTNPDIEWYHVFKDKYDHVYVCNNRLNMLDETNNVLYYIYSEGSNPYSEHTNYELNSNGEAVMIDYDPVHSHWPTIASVQLISQDWTRRNLTPTDTFDIYYKSSYSRRPYKVEDGILFGYNDGGYSSTFKSDFYWFIYDSTNDKATDIWIYDDTHNWSYAFGTYALEKYNILLIYNKFDRTLYYLPNAWDYYLNESGFTEQGNSASIEWSSIEIASLEIALEDCDLGDDRSNFLKYGLNGNTYYDVVIEEDEHGVIVVNSYVSGTYEEPQIKVVFQPINR